MFDLVSFIKKRVVFRDESLFINDIRNNIDVLKTKIEDKSFLVIGGAGSIGSSFIKAILQFKPSELVIVDINENALAELTRDLRSTKDLYIPGKYITYPMDYASNTFEKMFRHHGRFDVVGNFSAHKHVRSEKDIYSIEALIQNNVMNAKGLLDLLVEYPPEEYFCVSTDKAANPVNIMGASKRIMEDIIFSYSDFFDVKTARFANVAFSNGSLPAGFVARMSKLQPISAPYDVKRYFVSPEESGQICMLACMLGKNREIFFPKLAEEQMVTFDSIATEFIKAHGYRVLECNSDYDAVEKASELKKGSLDYPVHYSKSNTSGEKEYEEFYTNQENVALDIYDSLGVIRGKTIPDKSSILCLYKKLKIEFDKEETSKEKIINVLKEYLPNFEHIETGKNLDSKM